MNFLLRTCKKVVKRKDNANDNYKLHVVHIWVAPIHICKDFHIKLILCSRLLLELTLHCQVQDKLKEKWLGTMSFVACA